MTFPKFIQSNISEVILNKNAYGWGGVSLAFFVPLCRPARAFEARSKKSCDYGVHDVKFECMIECVSLGILDTGPLRFYVLLHLHNPSQTIFVL